MDTYYRTVAATATRAVAYTHLLLSTHSHACMLKIMHTCISCDSVYYIPVAHCTADGVRGADAAWL
eukprot:440744-Pleurochrysis_carterae.AAC.5